MNNLNFKNGETMEPSKNVQTINLEEKSSEDMPEYWYIERVAQMCQRLKIVPEYEFEDVIVDKIKRFRCFTTINKIPIISGVHKTKKAAKNAIKKEMYNALMNMSQAGKNFIDRISIISELSTHYAEDTIYLARSGQNCHVDVMCVLDLGFGQIFERLFMISRPARFRQFEELFMYTAEDRCKIVLDGVKVEIRNGIYSTAYTGESDCVEICCSTNFSELEKKLRLVAAVKADWLQNIAIVGDAVLNSFVGNFFRLREPNFMQTFKSNQYLKNVLMSISNSIDASSVHNCGTYAEAILVTNTNSVGIQLLYRLFFQYVSDFYNTMIVPESFVLKQNNPQLN